MIAVKLESPEQFLNSLIDQPDIIGQQALLHQVVEEASAAWLDVLAAAMKRRADALLRADIQGSLLIVELLLYLAEQTQLPTHLALGLGAKANAYALGGMGKFREAVALYDQLADLYASLNNPVMQAACFSASLLPLAHLGRFDEAFARGERAANLLRRHREWLWLAKLLTNLGVVHRRLGEDSRALQFYDEARRLYDAYGQGDNVQRALARLELNRVVALRHLGLFEESIEASEQAQAMLLATGQRVEAARTRQNLGITHFILGRYNEALALLDDVRDFFYEDGRHRDALLVDLFASNCLLQLRRFSAALHKCQQIRVHFMDIGATFEVAQSHLNEAVAYAGLSQYAEAHQTLAAARALFADGGFHNWVASSDLEKAHIHLQQGDLDNCLRISLSCADVFADHAFPLEQAQALLLAARAALILNDLDQAQTLVQQVLQITSERKIPTMAYQCDHLLGKIAWQRGDLKQAKLCFDRAAAYLERMRGQLMIEFRADFLEDKQTVYEDLVQLCLADSEAMAALMYAERAKSRALVELLAFRLDLSIEARDESDRPLVQELMRLRAERDLLYRCWQGNEILEERGETTPLIVDQQTAQRDVLAIETKITELWHRLLVRNAEYARDASLWQVRSEPFQPCLDADTLLIEYFVSHGQLILFLVTREWVKAYPLSVQMSAIQQLLRLLWMNLKSVPHSDPGRLPQLTANAQGILRKLYQHVLAACADELAPFGKLIVVPHGSLHYLPFHALFDGQAYLLSRFEVSYLPSASLLRYGRSSPQPSGAITAVGYSYNKKLPYAVAEAQEIADRWPGSGQVLLEDSATLSSFQAGAVDAQIIHLATHAEFRPDNPMFSGLAFADGWLATLDIFNLRLKASLVTLSACQTGRSMIGGGDELLGLMRAFLAAGAASLVLSYWAVADRSAAQLMSCFYANLNRGLSKGAALREAQRAFIDGRISTVDERSRLTMRHPYHWAPFYLVGNNDPL